MNKEYLLQSLNLSLKIKKYQSMNYKFAATFLFFLISLSCFAEASTHQNEIKQLLLNNGIGLGGFIAVVCSWERNKSILWAILHALFGWIYVIYFALTRHQDET